jgi:ATP-binding cassette subfamily F protein 3
VRALNDFEGAVVLISHDRHLMDACADRLWIVRGGTVKPYDGDIGTYRAECLAERGTDPNAPRARARRNGAAKPTAQEARRQAAGQRAALAPLKKRVTSAEAEIERLSRKIAAIDAALADTALYSREPARAQSLARERGELMRTREVAEAQWLTASEAYEQAQASG